MSRRKMAECVTKGVSKYIPIHTPLTLHTSKSADVTDASAISPKATRAKRITDFTFSPSFSFGEQTAMDTVLPF